MSKRRAVEKNDSLMTRLQQIVAAVNKSCPSETGDDTISIMGNREINKIPVLSSGSLALDIALGGGYPWGRIIEIFGSESAGKTTLVLHAIANVQKNHPDYPIAFVDAENSLDLYYAKKLGVDVSTIMINQPDSGEQGLNVIKQLIMNGTKLIVVDSIAALTPMKMVENEIGAQTMGVHAKLITEGFRTLNTLLATTKATILATNQLRDVIGGMSPGQTTTTGGRAFKFYASQRIELKRIGSDTVGDQRVNNIIVAKVAKNKISAPFMKAQFKITFGKGIDPIEQTIDFGLQFKLIEQAGAWYTIVGGEKFNGKKKMYEALEANNTLKNKLDENIMLKIKNDDAAVEGVNVGDNAGTAETEDAAKFVESVVVEQEQAESASAVKVTEA